MNNRTIVLEGTINTRDLGGLPGKDGRKVKKGLLIRTDCLYALTKNDIRFLSTLPVRYDVDFRNQKEIEERPEKEIPGCQIINLSITEDHCLGRTPSPYENYGVKNPRLLSLFDFIYCLSKEGDAKKGMEQSYRNYVSSKRGQEGYQKFLDLVLQNEGKGAILFHCADGKDRAGVASFLLLSALGVDFETILKDYLLTNKAIQKKKERRKEILLSYQVKEPLLSSSLILAGVEENWLEAARDECIFLAGSVDAYLGKYLSFTKEKKKRLQEIYLED